jgi:Fe2+ or Zn2+ uptake regulation protein
MERDLAATLRARGLQPSAQRLAIAEYVLGTDEHPSADQVWARVRRRLPMLSRATVYNTLNALVRARLLRPLVLAEGRVVFDPNVDRHHHFVDTATGRIHDVPWEAVEVGRVRPPAGYRVDDVHVILRGRRTAGRRGR